MEEPDRDLLAELVRRFALRDPGEQTERPFASLEDLLTSPHGFALTTATPLQRAICRILDGSDLGEYADHPHVKAAVGDVDAINGKHPRKAVILAGVRTGKSLIAAAAIVWAAMTVSTDGIRDAEIPRHSTLSTEKDLAKVILGHLVGALTSSTTLRSMLISEPTAEGCFLRMPCGRSMEARVVAGAKAGRSVVARWSAGLTADEAPRMAAAAESPINLEDTETAVEGRLLPGAQILAIGSPWAPFGPVFEDYKAHWGLPTQDLVVIKARADWLNPYWWTKERSEKLRKTNEVAFQTDFLAEFADVEDSLYTQALIDPCTRAGGNIDPEPGHDYAAAMDPATRGNAWTLVIGDKIRRVDRNDGSRSRSIKRIVYARQWQGSPQRPLRPRDVLREAAAIFIRYGLDWCYTDQWSADALVDIADDSGLDLIIEDWTHSGKTLAFSGFRDALADESISLPRNETLLADIRRVRRVVTRTGISVDLPYTGDGRHCDYAPAVVRCLTRWIDEDEEQPPEQGTMERENWEAEQRQIAAAAAIDEKQKRPWWDR